MRHEHGFSLAGCLCTQAISERRLRSFTARVLLRLTRGWRSQVGKAELRREGDRLRGARKALTLTLKAWSVCDAGNRKRDVAMSPSTLWKKKENVRGDE